MEIRAFTETTGSTTIRYQVTGLRDSALVWAEVVSGGGGGDGDGSGADAGTGSFGRLAAALPGMGGDDGLPAATTVLGGRAEGVGGERVAARLARRLGVAVFASVRLGEMGDVLGDRVVRRVAEELNAMGYGSAGL